MNKNIPIPLSNTANNEKNTVFDKLAWLIIFDNKVIKEIMKINNKIPGKVYFT